MAPVIMSFTGTGETVREAVNEAQQNANTWLKKQVPETTTVKALQTNTLNEASQATGGIIYTHIITLMVNQE